MNYFAIRKASLTDIPSVLNLYAQEDIDNGNILSTEAANNIFNKFQLYPNYFLYVAVKEDQVVATFALLIMDNLAHMGKPSGIIEDVVVSISYRSMGIGKKIMEFVMNECQKYGCYKLMLSSGMHREKAHKFYEKLGFRKHGYSFLVEFS